MTTVEETLKFFVPGIPIPGGSKRVFISPKTGKPIVTDDAGKKNKDWRRAIAEKAAEVMGQRELMVGPLCLIVEFRMPRLKGHYRTGQHSTVLKPSAPFYHTTRPDVLKLARVLEDALTNIVWRDDAQIARESLSKVYTAATPGAQVQVEQLNVTAKTGGG